MSDEERGPVQPTQETPKKGYGSKWKRYLVIYLLIAVVAYAVIYFAFIRDASGGGNGGGFGY